MFALLVVFLWVSPQETEMQATVRRLIAQEAPIGSTILFVEPSVNLQALGDEALMAEWVKAKSQLKIIPWYKRKVDNSKQARQYDLEIMARLAVFAEGRLVNKTTAQVTDLLKDTGAKAPLIQGFKDSSPQISRYFGELLDASEELIQVRTLPGTKDGQEFLAGICLARAYQECVVYAFRFWIGEVKQTIRVIVFPPASLATPPVKTAGLFLRLAVC